METKLLSRPSESLYSRLFTYRERREHRPVENFLSESLCDLFMRLPPSERVERIANLFVPVDLREAWTKAASGREVVLTTQKSLDTYGRPDIVVACDDEIMVIIENKVGAPICGDDRGSQLERYARWLRQKDRREVQPLRVVCLLSHLTPAPKLRRKWPSSVRFHHCRWAEVAEWLRSATKAEPNDGVSIASWRRLGAEFLRFLEEQEMTTELASFEDFARAIAYLPSGDKMAATFQKIYDDLRDLDGFQYGKKRGASWDARQVEYDSLSRLIWGYLYFNSHEANQAAVYLAYGLALNPEMAYPNAQPTAPSGEHLFLTVGWESWRSYPSEKLRKLQLSSKWHIDDEDRAAVLFRPATGFLTEKFAETIVNWVIAVKPDIRKLVKATARSGP